jgi:predicted metal-dependent enzyme (double-stranded beta helix superfamily)
MIEAIERNVDFTGWKPEAVVHEPLARLIYDLERAVGDFDPLTIALGVKKALEDAIRANDDFVPQRFLEPDTDRYARRLIYMGADRRFSLLAMVWGMGQGTPLHDHGGDWCVECVYRGAVKATNYRLEFESDGLCQFSATGTAVDVKGQANALVPPLEHHILENPGDSPAVTLHVYAHELTHCNAYLPVEGGYRRKACKLGYTA